MCECRAAIVLQWTKHWIGVDLVARARQKTGGIVAANIVAQRCDCAAAIDIEIHTRAACIQNGIFDLKRAEVDDASSEKRSRVIAERAIAELHGREIEDGATTQ
jgi:hypothetical protein